MSTAVRSRLPASLLESDSYLISRLRAGLHRRVAEASAAAGLRMFAGTILLAIGDLGPVSQRDLAQAIGMDPADLVAQLDGLQLAGLVAREPDPADRRRNVVALSALGWAKRDDWRLTVLAIEDTVLAPLGHAGRAALHQALTALADRDV